MSNVTSSAPLGPLRMRLETILDQYRPTLSSAERQLAAAMREYEQSLMRQTRPFAA